MSETKKGYWIARVDVENAQLDGFAFGGGSMEDYFVIYLIVHI